MQNINIDYSKVAEDDMPMYERVVSNAFAYIKNKYPMLCYCGLKINLSSYGGGSNFKPSKRTGWRIKVSNRHKMHFYDRNSCGLTTPKGGIPVPVELDATITLIHELTHYAQGVFGNGIYSEIDTTKNSIEYLEMYHPDIHKKLVKTKSNRVKKTTLEKLFSEITENANELITT